ncbi:hypothetical protein FRC02_001620 [Tulasnella sp. 418]|nr:hypothetical protein FRC02_001620 [Tulasnella sp. 418]
MHGVVAEFLKGIIAMSAPSPAHFPGNPGNINMLGSENLPLPTSNRLTRELVKQEHLKKLIGFMLDDPAAEHAKSLDTSRSSLLGSEDGRFPSTVSATSSLMSAIAIFIELIRKNNTDYFEPHLFYTLRNRLVNIQQQQQQQQQYARRETSEDEDREDLEKAMEELVDHMGMVHLSNLLDVVASRLDEFQKLVERPRSSIEPMQTTAGTIIPLTFERFRICELYAELLHCSNMGLLNRPASVGPTYDDEGRLTGGLKSLESLAKVIMNGASGEDEDDPEGKFPDRPPSRSTLSEVVDNPLSSGTDDGDAASDASNKEREKIKDAKSATEKTTASGASVSQSPAVKSPSPSETKGDSETGPSSSSDPPSTNGKKGAGEPSSSTNGESLGDAKGESDEKAAPPEDIPSGEHLKQRYLDLNVVSTLLDLFFAFPLNNFLHNVVYDLLHQIITGRVDKGRNRELVISLFRDSRLLHRIIDAQRKNDEACSKPKGVRLGYMGHLTLISEDIVSALEHYPEDLIGILSAFAPQPAWEEYVSGKYKETRDKDTSQLGGGKPAIGLGLGGFPASMNTEGLFSKKADEDTSAKGGTGRSREVTAYGSVTEPGERVDAEESGRSTEFAQYLASQITPNERYASNSSDNSSDEDEDDAGWLETANRDFSFSDETGDFDLNAQRASTNRDISDDSFDPGSTVTTSRDPFHDDDGWGPFSDNSTSSQDISSSFTFSASSDDDEFGDPFSDFGEFQGGGTIEVGSNSFDTDMDSGERTPTAGSSFSFDDDFDGRIFGSGGGEDEAAEVTDAMARTSLEGGSSSTSNTATDGKQSS